MNLVLAFRLLKRERKGKRERARGRNERGRERGKRDRGRKRKGGREGEGEYSTDQMYVLQSQKYILSGALHSLLTTGLVNEQPTPL